MLEPTECRAISPDIYIVEYQRLTKTKLTGKQLWLNGTIRYRWQKPIVWLIRWWLNLNKSNQEGLLTLLMFSVGLLSMIIFMAIL